MEHLDIKTVHVLAEECRRKRDLYQRHLAEDKDIHGVNHCFYRYWNELYTWLLSHKGV